MDINLDDLTIGDLEEIEDVVGETSDSIFKGTPSAKALKAIVYVICRRENPEFTLEDAAKVKVSDLSGGKVADPTESAV